MTEYSAISPSAEVDISSPGDGGGGDHGTQSISRGKKFWQNRRFIIIILSPILLSPVAILSQNPVSMLLVLLLFVNDMI